MAPPRSPTGLHHGAHLAGHAALYACDPAAWAERKERVAGQRLPQVPGVPACGGGGRGVGWGHGRTSAN